VIVLYEIEIQMRVCNYHIGQINFCPFSEGEERKHAICKGEERTEVPVHSTDPEEGGEVMNIRSSRKKGEIYHSRSDIGFSASWAREDNDNPIAI
jgi:hypothetical protein